MKYLFAIFLFLMSLVTLAQEKKEIELPVLLEELTAPDFIKAIEKSDGVCILPLGIMEKHGAHLPLGTDLFFARELSVRAAKSEYVVVFPPYYFGQINEARHQPGTLAYSPRLIWDLLQESCDELYRNGFTKIILVNGHGGNNDFLRYFVFSQNNSPHQYALYFYQPKLDEAKMAKAEKMVKSSVPEQHAGERETSEILAIRPDLVKIPLAITQDGSDLGRLDALSNFYTALWWYARFPNHYAGDAQYANPELGKYLLDIQVEQLVKSIREVKADISLQKLQEQFQNESQNPLKTKQ